MRGGELSWRGLDVPLRADLTTFAESTVWTRRWFSREMRGVRARRDLSRRQWSVSGRVWDRGGRRGLWKTLGIALRIIGCGEESQLIARPSEFAVMVIVASLLIEIVQKGKFCLVVSDEI